MEKFDVLVVGSGSGMTIVDGSLQKGLRTALVEMDTLGGTCLNRGCIPSKMVIYPIDLVQEIKRAEKLGVRARIEEIDFPGIMERVRRSVEEDRRGMEEGVSKTKELAYYHNRGEFVSDYKMAVGDETIQAKNIFLFSGARPDIPDIKGLSDVHYLTYREIWGLTKAPASMIIIGGGYISAEFAHFFSGVGVDVTVLSRGPILRQTEPEIGVLLTKSLKARMPVLTGVEFVEATEDGGMKEVTIRDEGGQKQVIRAESLLVATGVRGNADLLKVENTGVNTDANGYIKVNEFFETGKPRIWALGDAIGRAMFKHVANREAELVWHSFDHGHKQSLDYDKVPYAVFSWPQIAGVGLTEEEAVKRGLKVLTGVYNYSDTAYGSAMGEEDGFVKLVLEEESYKVLGCHIIGPCAPILVQEVVNVMYSGDGVVYPVTDALHIHPALSEVIQRTTWNLRRSGEVEPNQHD